MMNKSYLFTNKPCKIDDLEMVEIDDLIFKTFLYALFLFRHSKFWNLTANYSEKKEKFVKKSLR